MNFFPGPRDYSTIKGYFSSPVTFDHADWPKKFPDEMDKLFNKSNYFKGLWSHCPRYVFDYSN